MATSEAGNDLTRRIAALSPEKRALLELRLLQASASVVGRDSIPRRATAEPGPLSFSQQRLWFLEQLEPGSPLYNVFKVVQLRGRLDVPALQRALDQIVARHEALRTTLVATDGVPCQVIAANGELPLSQVDLTSMDVGQREAAALRLATVEVCRPFDLERGPLARALLIQLDETTHVLVVATHHIVSDGWSMGIFFSELEQLYVAGLARRPASLPELPVQYADFALWQRTWLSGESLQAQLDYWRQQLAGAPPLLELPADHARPNVQSFVGQWQSFALSEDLVDALKEIGRQSGATLFMMLLAAFKTLLARHSGQDDLVVGSPTAGRSRGELEGLIGFFVNTLVFRTDLGGDPTFVELLARVRSVALAAYANQDVSFERLVAELRPERARDHAPLVQVMFAFQNVPYQLPRGPGWDQEDVDFADLKLRPLDVGTNTAKFDLTLFIWQSGRGLTGSIEYNTDLFEPDTIARLIAHFQTLLEGIAANPDRRLSELPLLSDADQRQQLVEWNSTAVEYPRDRCIQELFEAQVRRRPEAVAVVFGERSLTYAELNRRANHLAHHLRHLGVGPEVLVGICAERSLELVVGLLAILKAGGAYLPLAPEYPAERLAFLLEDAQAPVLLTQSTLLAALPAYGGQVIYLDTDPSMQAVGSVEDLSLIVGPENLAYVTYTSGSSGPPRGVAIQHRSVVRLVRGVDYVRLDETEVLLQLAPLSFDASTFEIWGSLLNGARLVVFPATRPSLKELGEVLARHAVTTLWLTAGFFHQMVEYELPALRGLRQLIAGGDVLSPAHLRRVLDELPGCRLVNGYGPTECTTFACCWPVGRAEIGSGSAPIGRPIANTSAYILDQQGRLVPLGVVGELHLGGDGLARGYFNRPELTAEKFVLHPFSAEPGARLYRTGDLARYRPDGNIEFVGRLDEQVKIRGFRVEPGEVETVLEQHPEVRSAVVLAVPNGPADRRLVAYVVPGGSSVPASDDLRGFLREKLPEYLVPAAFVPLETLPLSSNGKVDRRALPAPTWVGSTFVPPTTETERRLAKIWGDLLGCEMVGATDDFFELGGHSLLAMRLCAEVEKTFGLNLPLSSLFPEPTVQRLAREIERREASPASSLVPIQPHGLKRPLFCVHAIDGDVLVFASLARRLGPDRPLYALRARGLDGRAQPFADIRAMAAHYLEELRAVQPVGPFALSGFCAGGAIAFEMAQQLRAAGEEVALLAIFDGSAPDLTLRTVMIKPVYWLRLIGYVLTRVPFWARRLGSFDHQHRLATLRFKYTEFSAWARTLLSVAGLTPYRVGDRLDQALDLNDFDPPRQAVVLEGYRALRDYRPAEYPGRLILFEGLGRSMLWLADPSRGWGQLARGGVEIKQVAAHHIDMLVEPHVADLARQLTASLDASEVR